MQGAIAWDKGEVVLGPLFAEFGPINKVLNLLGVEVGTAFDEFEALELWKHRQTEDWLKEIES